MRPRLSLAVLISLLLMQSAAIADAAGKKPDVAFLLGFLGENYRLVGQKPDSGAAYPRLTGYVYRLKGATKSPGIEALVHLPPTPAK